MYTNEQEKRGLFPYDDKRYLLADMPEGHLNINTLAYGHRDLSGRDHLMADQLKPCAKQIIQHFEE